MWLLGMVSGHLILQFSGKEQDVFYPQTCVFKHVTKLVFPKFLFLVSHKLRHKNVDPKVILIKSFLLSVACSRAECKSRRMQKRKPSIFRNVKSCIYLFIITNAIRYEMLIIYFKRSLFYY